MRIDAVQACGRALAVLPEAQGAEEHWQEGARAEARQAALASTPGFFTCVV